MNVSVQTTKDLDATGRERQRLVIDAEDGYPDIVAMVASPVGISIGNQSMSGCARAGSVELHYSNYTIRMVKQNNGHWRGTSDDFFVPVPAGLVEAYRNASLFANQDRVVGNLVLWLMQVSNDLETLSSRVATRG